MEPRYKIGQNVTINGKVNYAIQAIEKHGNGICGCCFGAVYFLYKVSGHLWINESELDPVLSN